MDTQLKKISYNNKEIEVIFQQYKKLPIFNLQLIFQNSGYINDTKLSGVTNICAKMLNEGTLNISSYDFSKKLEDEAIEIYFHTGLEIFSIEISCLKQSIPKAIKYLSLILKEPNITKKNLDKMVKLQLSKIARQENDFDHIASSNLKSLIYKDSALMYPSYGTSDDIKKIKLKDIKSRIKDILNINNLVIVGGGDIPYSDFKNSIKDIFKYFYNNQATTIKKIPFNGKIKDIVVHKDTQQSYIYFASEFKSIPYLENYKVKLFSFILGSSGFGSRLMEIIRVKQGLAYSVYANIINQKSHSYLFGYLQTKIQNTQKAKDMVKNEIENFIKNGVTQEELDTAKNFILGNQPLRNETFSQKLRNSFSYYYKDLPIDYEVTELNNINNISLKQLNDFIKEQDITKNLIYSIVTK